MYLWSIGVRLPMFGVYWHRYFHVKRFRKYCKFSFCGIAVVTACYRVRKNSGSSSN